jgi:hypothetical protein
VVDGQFVVRVGIRPCDAETAQAARHAVAQHSVVFDAVRGGRYAAGEPGAAPAR